MSKTYLKRCWRLSSTMSLCRILPTPDDAIAVQNAPSTAQISASLTNMSATAGPFR